MLSNSRSSDSPVFFSDVSTVDSSRPIDNVDYCPASNYRPSEPPSIVERNARIIKWLCNCRKSQLTWTSITAKFIHSCVNFHRTKIVQNFFFYDLNCSFTSITRMYFTIFVAPSFVFFVLYSNNIVILNLALFWLFQFLFWFDFFCVNGSKTLFRGSVL